MAPYDGHGYANGRRGTLRATSGHGCSRCHTDAALGLRSRARQSLRQAHHYRQLTYRRLNRERNRVEAAYRLHPLFLGSKLRWQFTKYTDCIVTGFALLTQDTNLLRLSGITHKISNTIQRLHQLITQFLFRYNIIKCMLHT